MTITNPNRGGVSLLGALLLIFITLKLCRVIDWSWWLVLWPVWVSLAMEIIILLLKAVLLANKEKKKP